MVPQVTTTCNPCSSALQNHWHRPFSFDIGPSRSRLTFLPELHKLSDNLMDASGSCAAIMKLAEGGRL
jgi:hypothetical protein